MVSVVAGVAALGGLLFGYDTGIIGSALLYITREFKLSTLEAQLVTSAIIAGALLGCMGAGPLSDRIGRRLTVMLAGIVFAAGSVGAALAGNVEILILARFVLGLAVGGASQIVPVYIAELAPPARRGGLVVLFQLAVVGGITISYIVGYGLSGGESWRLMLALGAIPAVILLLGMIPLPESPRWLALQGRDDEARRVLTRLRTDEAQAAKELEEIGQAKSLPKGGWKELGAPWLRPALIAAVGIALFCQITGVNAVLYYAPTIFAAAGFGDQTALLTSIGIGVFMTASTMFGLYAVDKWGRRPLLVWMLPGAVVSLIVLGAMFAGGEPQGWRQVVAILSIIGYVIFNVGSLSVAIWLVGSEVFPLAVRGKGAALVALTHWSADLLVSLTTLSLTQGLGTGWTFWLFALINLLAWLFVLRFVPETRGQSLERIEQALRNGRFAAMR